MSYETYVPRAGYSVRPPDQTPPAPVVEDDDTAPLQPLPATPSPATGSLPTPTVDRASPRDPVAAQGGAPTPAAPEGLRRRGKRWKSATAPSSSTASRPPRTG